MFSSYSTANDDQDRFPKILVISFVIELRPWFGCAYTQLKHIAQILPHCTVCRLPEDNMMAMRPLMDDKHGGMGRMKAIFPVLDVWLPLSSSQHQTRSWSFMQNFTSLVLRAASSLLLLNIAMWLLFEILRCQELCKIRVILHHTPESIEYFVWRPGQK